MRDYFLDAKLQNSGGFPAGHPLSLRKPAQIIIFRLIELLPADKLCLRQAGKMTTSEYLAV